MDAWWVDRSLTPARAGDTGTHLDWTSIDRPERTCATMGHASHRIVRPAGRPQESMHARDRSRKKKKESW